MAQYHLHPESKFEHADFLDRGETRRWHIQALFPEYIGKEANRWEEQVHVGDLPDAQIVYGQDRRGTTALIRVLRRNAKQFGYVSRLARQAGINRKTADAVIKGLSKKPDLLVRVFSAHRILEDRRKEQFKHSTTILKAARRQCVAEGGREFARRAGLDWGDLSATIAQRRSPSKRLLAKLEAVLESRRDPG